MATRLGIELSPAACRIVEIEGGPAFRRRQRDTRVVSFSVLPPSGPETRAKLASLRERSAAVIVWGATSEHRQVMVTSGSHESMRAEAIDALTAAGLQTHGLLVDIAPPAGAPGRGARRPVLVALASATEVSAALRPLRNAGIRLRTVATPAVALGSLARLRRALSVPGTIEAYVALESTDTCLALVRDGALVAARERAWGYVDHTLPLSTPRRLGEVASRLADDIGEFVTTTGGSAANLGQVCVCGGLPELRSMTAPLVERLDVEVEPLDSLFGIDVTRLPEPADEFRERGAELRLAWAVAADWPPAVNLLRAPRRQVSETTLARAAVAAGIAAGLVLGWRVQQSAWWQSTASKPTARTASSAARGRASAPPPAARATAPVAASKPALPTASPVAVSKSPVATAPPIAVTKTPPPIAAPPLGVNETAPSTSAPPLVANRSPATTAPTAAGSRSVPASSSLSRPPAATPPQAAVNGPPPARPRPAPEASAVPIVLPPVVPPVTAAPPRQSEPGARQEPSVRRASGTQPPESTRGRQGSPQARARRPAPSEVPLPFDAVLGTILYSPDRRLAIIDGRIVGPGDDVRGARVVDITPDAVLLRDAQGRLRRLPLR